MKARYVDFVQFAAQRFHEDVSHIGCHQDPRDQEGTCVDVFANEVIFDVYVFGTQVVRGVGGQRN